MGVWDSPTTEARTLRQKALAAFANNQAFLALTPPITLGQAQAQLFALTRQMNGLLRLEFNQLNDISDS